MCFTGRDGDLEATAQEKQLAEDAKNDWNDYKEFYRPAEDRYIEELDAMGGETERARMRGKSAATVMQGLNRGGGMGMNPLSLQAHAGAEEGMAGGHSAAIVGSDIRSDKRVTAGKQGIVSIGRGIKNEGTTALSRSANIEAAKKATQAAIDQSRSAFASDLAATAVGVGGMTAYNAATKSPMDDFTAEDYQVMTTDDYRKPEPNLGMGMDGFNYNLPGGA